MPWHLIERDGRFCVAKEGETEPIPGGCHDSRDQAESQLAALYANEPSARSAAAPCSCGGIHPGPGGVAFLGAATEPFDAPFPVPAYPPREWFTERPEWLTPETKIGVDDEGRVAGYFWNAGQCLLYRPDACPKPSPTRYAAFHQSHVAAADGELVEVGVIGNTHGHAHPLAHVDAASRHYQDPSAQLISCRAYDDEHGGYILGSVVPNATYGDVALIRRSALSGDWRHMPRQWWDAHGVQAGVVSACEGFDCIGPTLVTRPGLPIVRRFAGRDTRHAAILGGVGGIQLEELMSETKIDLPGGISVTTTGPVPPGPQPIQAAGPPPLPPEEHGEDEDEAGGAVSREEFDALASEVVALRTTVEQFMDGQMDAMAAAVPPLPAPATG